MEVYINYFNMFLSEIKPYWAELIGAFLMATMVNLTKIKGTQKEGLDFLSMAFYAIVLKDIALIILNILPVIRPDVVLPDEAQSYTRMILISLASSLLISSALKNLKLYFNPILMISMLTVIFSAGAIVLPRYEQFYSVAPLLSPLYLTLSLFMLGGSFYLNKSTRQNRAVRSVGNGLIVLSVCYAYQAFDLISNFQLILLLCYTIAMVLSLGGQIQFLNVYTAKLERKIETDRKSKKEIWDFSPFPIVISRLRDDAVLYMNPAACEMLALKKDEYYDYPLSAYFVEKGKREELLDNMRQMQVVQSFEVQVKHPKKNNDRWIDLTTRTTDMDEEIVLFTTFKDITEQKKTEKILKQQASTDPLTGLYNRRQFEILAYQGLQTAKRYNTSYSVLMLDIDFFKKINDTYGHDAGDEVLKNLAVVLKETVRKSDVVARYGGEEFVAFLPQTTPAEALIAAEHIREAVEKMKTQADDRIISATVSIGISDHQSFDLNVLIKQADEALYDSKKSGRNRVTLYQDVVLKKIKESEITVDSEKEENGEMEK